MQAVAKMYNKQASNYDSTISIAFVLLSIDIKERTPLMGIESTSLFSILRFMESKKLITRERNLEDGRSIIIKLTESDEERRKISRNHVKTINKLIDEKKTYDDVSFEVV